MPKLALSLLLSLLMLPSAFAGNGVERGSPADVMAPAFAPIFAPIVSHVIAEEVKDRCALSGLHGQVPQLKVQPRSVSRAGEKLIYQAVVGVSYSGEDRTEEIRAAAIQSVNEAPVVKIDSERCTN